MAAQVPTALVRMSLSQAAAAYATDTMGLDTIEAWRDFHVDDDLEGLAKNLRSPGGREVFIDKRETRQEASLLDPEDSTERLSMFLVP